MNVSENTIISYKYAFISLLEYIIENNKTKIKDIKIETINRKVIIDYLEYLEVVKKNSISNKKSKISCYKIFL